MNVINNLKLAIVDFEHELTLQHAQFELFRRVWSNTGELPESVTMRDLEKMSIQMTLDHELLVWTKNELKKEQSLQTIY